MVRPGRAGRGGGIVSDRYIDDEPSGDEVVCPWCNHEHRDSWDYDWTANETAEIDCEECGKTFEARRSFDVTYYSSRKPAGSAP